MCLYLLKTGKKVKYVFKCKINSTEFASAIDETFRSKVSARLNALKKKNS